MESTIESILRDNYCDNAFFTHNSLIQPRGKYQFNRQSLEEFWRVYCDMVYNSPNPSVGMAEKPQNYLPVLVDVDLKVNADEYELDEDKLYNEDDVKAVIQTYQSVLRNIVEDCEDSNLVCVFLYKPPYRVKNDKSTIVKNGFHLHFPCLFLEREDQEVHLIPRVKEELNKTELFKEIGYDNPGDVIDKACCSATWLLYGSKKEETALAYKYSKTYDANCNEISINDAFKDYTIFDNKEKLIPIRGKIHYYLPRILSIVPYNRNGYIKEVKSGLVPIRIREAERREPSLRKYDEISDEQAVRLAEAMLGMISDSRADDYNEWMTIGWALYNVSNGNDSGLNLWLQFSKRSDKFDETKCIYEWDRMTKTDMTIGTLKYYASIDNPGKFAEFKKEDRDKLVKFCINNGSHNDIARVLHTEYAGQYVCASVSNKLWYEFNGNIWIPIEDGVDLREKISGSVVEMFSQQAKEISSKMGQAEVTEHKFIESQIKTVNKIIKDLKTAPFKDNVMKECREVFYDRRFLDKLDKNPNLIAFKNGVLDAKNYTFRSGRPEDFLSKCMPINYVEFLPDDEKVISVNNFLEKVFPDTSVRAYFLDISSEVFVGGNHRKIVQAWTGGGDNGKSITQMFFDTMLGELAVKAPTTLITSKKPMNGAAWPELVRAGNGARELTMDEPDDSEEINIGILKQLSGNDTFCVRDLFQKGRDMREFRPLFKVKLICNKLPTVKGDQAFWNRMRVIPFESTFCNESNPAPDTYEEQLRQKRFPMDKNFSSKISDLVEAFCWVLLNHGRHGNKLKVEPEKVIAATTSYRKKNDVYRQFIEECIVETNSDKDKLSLIELYGRFKEWYRESMPNHEMPSKSDVKEYFYKVWSDPNAGIKWPGYRLRTFKDDNDGEEDEYDNDEDQGEFIPV